MLVSKPIFPLAAAVERVRQQMEVTARTGGAPRRTFT
jgi:hypothetical protein